MVSPKACQRTRKSRQATKRSTVMVTATATPIMTSIDVASPPPFDDDDTVVALAANGSARLEYVELDALISFITVLIVSGERFVAEI